MFNKYFKTEEELNKFKSGVNSFYYHKRIVLNDYHIGDETKDKSPPKPNKSPI